jgi:pyridoxamine 5'-phosphate oxidase
MPILPPSLVDLLTAPSPLPQALPADPFPIFKAWLDEETAAKRQPAPNSMCVATIGPSGPRARILLCRGLDVVSGYIVFFTNYDSDKGRELTSNPIAAATFHWDHSDRQVRLEGPVVKSPPAESDAYFRTRPWESRLSAWASKQSRPLKDREQLMDQYADVIAKLGLDPTVIARQGAETVIPRPPHWGGFRLWPTRVELWTGGPGRMHDRAAWSRTLAPFHDGFTHSPWQVTRLQP